MRDPKWESIERELKRLPHRDPDAVGRVMAKIRSAEPQPAAPSVWKWWTRPRSISISPLGGLLAAAVVSALVAVPSLSHRGESTGTIQAPIASAEPGILPAVMVGSPGSLQPVQFVLVANEASRVSLVGDFNNWDPEATPLLQTAEEGVWSAVVPLRSGRYLYAFLIDGTRWVADAGAPRGPESAFGSNSVILVGEGL